MSNQFFHREFGENIFEWLLQRHGFTSWMIQQLDQDPDLKIFSRISDTSSLELGRALLGMKEWTDQKLRVVSGDKSMLEPTFLTRRINQESKSNPFLAHACAKGVPVSKSCLKMLGDAIKKTSWFTHNRAALMRQARANKVVQEVLVA